MKDSIEVLTGIESQLKRFEREIRHGDKFGPTIVVFVRGDSDEDTWHFLQIPVEHKHLVKKACEGEPMFPIGFFTHKVVDGRIQRIVKAIDCQNLRKWVVPPAGTTDGKGLTFQRFFEKLLGIQADDFMREIAKNCVQ